jgi:hypothetical protein
MSPQITGIATVRRPRIRDDFSGLAKEPQRGRARALPGSAPSVIYVCYECLPPASDDHSPVMLAADNCAIHGLTWHRRAAWTKDGWLSNCP